MLKEVIEGVSKTLTRCVSLHSLLKALFINLTAKTYSCEQHGLT